jgi:hypothetical protein
MDSGIPLRSSRNDGESGRDTYGVSIETLLITA